jgi:hypothetical protein
LIIYFNFAFINHSNLQVMLIGAALFLIFFGLAFWVLIFVMSFVGVWASWGGVAMAKAKFAKKGLDNEEQYS